MPESEQRKVRVFFRDPSHPAMALVVEDKYEITFSEDGEWLVLPQARVRASEVLTVQILPDGHALKAA